jgi:HK97 family phage major capsid protein
MTNPYLERLRLKYDGVKNGIEGFQTRAAKEDRDLTEDELRSIKSQAEDLKTLAKEIADLTEIEDNNNKVASLRSALAPKEEKRTGTAYTQAKDPGHYRSEKEGGKLSFFSDIVAAQNRDEDAARRLTEHNRALTTGSNGPGVVAPHWLTEEFQTLNRQQRAAANAVRRIPLGTDPRPLTLPKQTVGAAVAAQTNENDAVLGTDAWDSDVDVVSPKPLAGKQTVSRQMVDMSDPAIDQLIYGDLISDYNSKLETQVCTALLAAAGTTVVTFADEAAFAASGAAVGAVIDASTKVWAGRFAPADTLISSIPRFGKFRKLVDSTGRPLMPFAQYGPQNAAGVQNGLTGASIEGLNAVATSGIGTGLAAEKFLVIRAQDTLLFESDTLRFRYDEQVGPESIVLGVWGYTAVKVRNTESVKSVTMTAVS